MRIKVHEKQETELSRLVKAYVRAVSGDDAVPDTVTMVSKTPIDDDGSVLVEFEFTGNGPKSTGGTTYALVYGDLYTNTDKDLLYFLHDWQSGETVTPEDIEEHDWELANDYIRPSDILNEAFGSLDDMLSKEEQDIVLKAYKDALKEALTYIQGALPEGYTPTQLSFGNPFYTSVGTEKPSAGRYDPDRFGPHLFNISVDFLDGISPKVAFRVDVTDPKTGETTVQRKLVYVDPFVEDFLGMKKPAFRLLPSDADKVADVAKKAFRKTEAAEAPEDRIRSLLDVANVSKHVTDADNPAYKDAGTAFLGKYLPGSTYDGSETDGAPGELVWYVLWFTYNGRGFRLDVNKDINTGKVFYELHEILANGDYGKEVSVTPEILKVAIEPKSESAQYRVSVDFTPEPPFGYGDQNFLFKGLDIVDEEFPFPSEKEAEEFAQDCANRMTARNRDLESDGLQDGEIRVYYTNRDYVDRMVRNAGKAYAALMDKPAFPVLVARIVITKE